jgi:hypothetical protein
VKKSRTDGSEAKQTRSEQSSKGVTRQNIIKWNKDEQERDKPRALEHAGGRASGQEAREYSRQTSAQARDSRAFKQAKRGSHAMPHKSRISSSKVQKACHNTYFSGRRQHRCGHCFIKSCE